MTYNLYCYYDRVAGLYSAPIPAVNDATALRSFVDNQRGNPSATDMDIYRVGSFNIQSGDFCALDRPEFVAGYSDCFKAGDPT